MADQDQDQDLEAWIRCLAQDPVEWAEEWDQAADLMDPVWVEWVVSDLEVWDQADSEDLVEWVAVLQDSLVEWVVTVAGSATDLRAACGLDQVDPMVRDLVLGRVVPLSGTCSDQTTTTSRRSVSKISKPAIRTTTTDDITTDRLEQD